MRGFSRKKWIFFLFASLLVVAACSDAPYMAHCAKGQMQLLWQRTPIEKVISDPQCSPELKKQLTKSLDMRDFASQELKLPQNGSYRSYADVGRPYVVWNVVAAPEFSLTPRQWCFPFAGCVSYRGYFTPEKAQSFADSLKEQGLDVYLYGVTAYSTLTWFDDPVLNTFCNYSDTSLAGLIFHELAHQELYVKNDSTFNESFAKTVELEGVRRWLDAHGTPQDKVHYAEKLQREDDFISIVLKAKKALEKAYATETEPKQLRDEKNRIFGTLQTDYDLLKTQWGGYAGYDRWFSADLNNAKLASVNTYRHYVPAFEELLQQSHGDLGSFYEKCRQLGDLPKELRSKRMDVLLKEYQDQHHLAQALD